MEADHMVGGIGDGLSTKEAIMRKSIDGNHGQSPVAIAFILCAFLGVALALAGCGTSQSASSSGAAISTSDASSESMVGGQAGIANPMEEFESAEALYAATGFSADVPDGATDVSFYRIADTGISEVFYMLDGLEVTYRGKSTTAFEDISGVYETTWTEQDKFTDSYGRTMNLSIIDGEIATVAGFDSADKMTYCFIFQGSGINHSTVMAAYAKAAGGASGRS